jgi:hypothetical protein
MFVFLLRDHCTQIWTRALVELARVNSRKKETLIFADNR